MDGERVGPLSHKTTEEIVMRAPPEMLVKALLNFVGENPERGGLLETPARYLKALREYTVGYGVEPSSVLKCFEDGSEGYDEMVIQKNIPIHSLCEHHLAPFFGVAHIAYIPHKKIVGLSKLSRLADVFARRLQVQERLTKQIADSLEKHLEPLGVGVVLNCRHFCIECRGVKKVGSSTITSALRGALRSNASARAEFMSLVQ